MVFQSCIEVIWLIFVSILFSIAWVGPCLSNCHFQLSHHIPSQTCPVYQPPEQICDGASAVPRAPASFCTLPPHPYSATHALPRFSLFPVIPKNVEWENQRLKMSCLRSKPAEAVVLKRRSLGINVYVSYGVITTTTKYDLPLETM